MSSLYVVALQAPAFFWARNRSQRPLNKVLQSYAVKPSQTLVGVVHHCSPSSSCIIFLLSSTVSVSTLSSFPLDCAVHSLKMDSQEIASLKTTVKDLKINLQRVDSRLDQLTSFAGNVFKVSSQNKEKTDQLFEKMKAINARLKSIEAFADKIRPMFDAFKLDDPSLSIDESNKVMKFGRFVVSFALLSPDFMKIDPFFRGVLRQCFTEEEIKDVKRSKPNSDFQLILDATIHLWNTLCKNEFQLVRTGSKNVTVSSLVQTTCNLRSNIGK